MEGEYKGEGKGVGGSQEDSASGVDRQAQQWEEEPDDNIGSGDERREARGNNGRREVAREDGGDVA